MTHHNSEGSGKIEPSVVVSLAEAISILPKSIVSRTLVDNPSGTITLFAFDTGQGLSEHTAPFDAFVQVLEGKLELTIGEKSLTPIMGEVVLMPANVPHALRALSPTRMMLVMIRG